MTSITATVLTLLTTLQTYLLSINQNLLLTNHNYPANTTLTDGSSYDVIIVGSGTGGSVIANRLSANSSISVLLIEAGDFPPWESEVPGLFPLLLASHYDYNVPTQNDNVTAQSVTGNVTWLTQGKMLGGSSGLHHMIHVQGDPQDYNVWAEILGDDSWNYTNLLPYFKKTENLQDAGLLNSSFADLHGTDGPVKIKREQHSSNANYFAAIKEAGWNVVEDTTSVTSSLGFSEPLLNIDSVRQSTGYAYLSLAKNRDNLKVALSSQVTKVLISNGTAYGVEVLCANGETIEVYANKEVIVSAGAIHTPALLMRSGIGPADHLTSLNISVVADLPVGQNLTDHPSCVMFYQLENDTSTTPPTDYNMFPVPMITGYAAVNSSQTYPDWQSIMLFFPHDSTAMIQLCSIGFKYKNEICDTYYAASAGRTTLFSVHNLMKPKSRGEVLLASADYSDEPLVYTNYLSNSDDMDLMAKSTELFNSTLLNTAYFQEIDAKLVNPTSCDETSSNFWSCYGLAMSSTMWHYSGTCALGSVLDTDFKVKYVKNMRVVDASALPDLVSGNINAAVNMLAERAAAKIIEQLNQ